jgi:hypothetical protein
MSEPDFAPYEPRPFAFYPELLDLRTQVIEILNQAGVSMFVDYSNIDVDHDGAGRLEIEGFASLERTRAAYEVLYKNLTGVFKRARPWESGDERQFVLFLLRD